ncbi:MAG: hypothetical protein IJT73_07045 [Selenomonadaceae bacterium]|nr:hypothetical protein [Selenomonadaceae bacterium]
MTFQKIMLVKLVWMRYYQWQQGDIPFGDIKYLKEMNTIDGVADISENLNFLDCGGSVFGYFQTKGKSPRIEKIEGETRNKNCESVDNVLVIFCAPNPERKGKGETTIIGWYKKATVYRDEQYNENFDLYYNIRAELKNCVLLPESERKDNQIWWLKQTPGSEINFGQSMYKFPSNTTPELQDILQEIANYDGENWCGEFSLNEVN